MAMSDPDAETALGSNAGFISKTRWFARKASTVPISTTKTVESAETAMSFGCELVDAAAGLCRRVTLYQFEVELHN